MTLVHLPLARHTHGTGIPRYSLRLMRHVPGEIHDPDVKEIQIGRFRIGGYITKILKHALWPVPDAEIVHAHAPPRYHRNANVLTIHDLDAYHRPEEYGLQSRIWSRIVDGTAEKLDAIIVPSHHVKEDVLDTLTFPSSKVHVIEHGIDHRVFCPRPDLPTQGFALVVGDVRPRKLSTRMLKALQLEGVDTVRVGPPVTGDGSRGANQQYRETFEHLAQNGPAGWGYEDLGYVTRARLADLYRKAGMLVFCSREEGFGFPALEAAACGTPTVLGPARVNRERKGLGPVTDGSVAQIREGVREVIEAPPDPKRLVEEAAGYSWERSARLHAQVYQGVGS